jgi:hypothetical protein
MRVLWFALQFLELNLQSLDFPIKPKRYIYLGKDDNV